MNKRLVIGILVAVILAGAAVALAAIPFWTLRVRSTATHGFTIDQSMHRVRKILVRTNAVKKIVAMAEAKLIDQKWLNMHFQLDRPILEGGLDLHGTGRLVVLLKDDYLGTHEITLDQTVNIKRNSLSVVSNLQRPVGPIRRYYSTLHLVPDERGNAQFETTLELEIETKASWLIAGIVKSRIRESAAESLRNQEKAIREVVASHADDPIILPQFR